VTPFICLDGTDGSGKSTQCQLLSDYFTRRGDSPLVLSHPAHSGLGGFVRKLLHEDRQRFNASAEAFLYAAALSELIAGSIMPAMQAGRPVLAHRWWYSSVVFQSSVDGAGCGLVRQLSRLAVADVTPTVGLIIVCDPVVAMSRIGSRAAAVLSPYENLSNLQKAHEGFELLLSRYHSSQEHDGITEPLFRVDTTSNTPEETHSEILSLVKL
jgi:dTMP kinase